jgi:hypothetical protein
MNLEAWLLQSNDVGTVTVTLVASSYKGMLGITEELLQCLAHGST